MLLHANGRVRLEEHERNSETPATVAPPIPAAHDARRQKTPPLIGGMWKVLAAQNDAISLSETHALSYWNYYKILRQTLCSAINVCNVFQFSKITLNSCRFSHRRSFLFSLFSHITTNIFFLVLLCYFISFINSVN